MESDSKQIFLFFLLVIPLAWVFWIPMIYITHGVISFPFPIIIISSLGGISPLIALYLVEKICYRHATPPKLLESIFDTAHIRRFDVKWLVLAAFILPTIAVISIILNYTFGFQSDMRIIARGPDELGWGLMAIIPIHFTAALLTSPLFEEPGWRGFAITRLDNKIHPFFASIIVGSYWWLWHQGMNIAFDILPSIEGYLSMLAMSFLIDAIFRKSDRNLLTAMFIHSGANIMNIYFYSITPDYIRIFLMIGATIAIYLIKSFKK